MSETGMFVDSHIHLSHRQFEQSFPYLYWDEGCFALGEGGTRDRLIEAMRENGIRFCVEPGIDPESNRRLLALAERYRGFVLPAVGIHPTRTYRYGVVEDGRSAMKPLPWRARQRIAKLAENELTAAIGETGLDYHLSRKEQHRMRQILWFIWQLRLADRRKLPVILHIRQADSHALTILRLFRKTLHGGVCHCFSGTPEQARQYISLGLKLGIGASLLQENEIGRDLKCVIRETRLEDLLLETDAPYVKPPCPGMTGKQRKKARNTSLILPAMAEKIAEIKGVSREEVALVTTKNAELLFRKAERA